MNRLEKLFICVHNMALFSTREKIEFWWLKKKKKKFVEGNQWPDFLPSSNFAFHVPFFVNLWFEFDSLLYILKSKPPLLIFEFKLVELPEFYSTLSVRSSLAHVLYSLWTGWLHIFSMWKVLNCTTFLSDIFH